MRVLHVTESFASGVLTFIEDLTRKQVQTGITPHVLYVPRPESPSRDEAESRFAPGVILHDPILPSPPQTALLVLARRIRALFRQFEFDAVHLHSSKAGVVGRLVMMGHRDQTFYSPHGFAFLRLSSSRVSRFMALSIERMLSPLGSLVLTSASEVEIARDQLHAKSVHYLRSGVSRDTVTPKKFTNTRPRVITMARMVYQKAPWRFAAVARELADIADFTWIGGDAEGSARWIADAPVEVIEWLSSEDLSLLIEGADVMLFPTLWEGFSLALVQAQAAGLPVVTTDVVGNRDAVIDGVTGYVCHSDDELVHATRRLVLDGELRKSMSAAAQMRVSAEFINDFMGIDSKQIYLSGRNRTPQSGLTRGDSRE